MSDFKLITKKQVNDIPVPPQSGVTTEYFGDRSNDIQLDTLNDFEVVSGVTKLRQDINKILLTVRGKNTNNTIYGSALQEMIGHKSNQQVLQARIRDEIITALQVLQRINVENTNADERISILKFLRVESIDQINIQVQISVVTVSGKEVTAGTTIST